jgi:hypothetical protein
MWATGVIMPENQEVCPAPEPTEPVAVTAFVPEWNIHLVEKFVAKMQKKARKLGLPPLVLTQTGRVKYETHEGMTVRFAEITVTGASPVLSGWILCGTIEHSPAGNIHWCVPGREIPDSLGPDRCDQCGYVRYRKWTYVVRSDAGEYKQVGKECLSDFVATTGSNPRHIVSALSFIQDLTERVSAHRVITGSVERAWVYVPVDKMLAVSRQLINSEGRYCPASMENTSTGNRAWAFCVEGASPTPITVVDQSVTAACVAYWRGVSGDRGSFEHNANEIATSGFMRPEHKNIVAGMMWGYLRTIGEFRPNQSGGYLPEAIGADVTVVGKCTESRRLERTNSFGGHTTLVAFFTPDNQRIVWWSTVGGRTVGKWYKFTALVKNKEEYRDTKTTIVSHVHVVEEYDANPVSASPTPDTPPVPDTPKVVRPFTTDFDLSTPGVDA